MDLHPAVTIGPLVVEQCLCRATDPLEETSIVCRIGLINEDARGLASERTSV